jgi:hypothetical protein
LAGSHDKLSFCDCYTIRIYACIRILSGVNVQIKCFFKKPSLRWCYTIANFIQILTTCIIILQSGLVYCIL